MSKKKEKAAPTPIPAEEAPKEIVLEKVEESANMISLLHSDSNQIIRVPKDPKNIPDKSIIIGTTDITSEVKKLVKKLVKEEK